MNLQFSISYLHASIVVSSVLRLRNKKLVTYLWIDLQVNYTLLTVEWAFSFTLSNQGRRKELRSYGVLFTCISSRAVQFEAANSFDASSFINSVRRLLSVRRPIRQLSSDRETNFVGARRDLREALEQMDDSHLKKCPSEKGFDCIVVTVNFPSTSQKGGVWNSLQCLIITEAGLRNSDDDA